MVEALLVGVVLLVLLVAMPVLLIALALELMVAIVWLPFRILGAFLALGAAVAATAVKIVLGVLACLAIGALVFGVLVFVPLLVVALASWAAIRARRPHPQPAG